MNVTRISAAIALGATLTACSSATSSPPTSSAPASAAPGTSSALPSPSAVEDAACVLNKQLIQRLPILGMAPLDESEAKVVRLDLEALRDDLPTYTQQAAALPKTKPATYFSNSLVGLDMEINLYLSALGDYVTSGMDIMSDTREQVAEFGKSLEDNFHDTTLICDALP